MTITYAGTIPNNVDLGSDKVLQRALEHWQPEFLKWWMDMGPEGSHSTDVYYVPPSVCIRAAGRISIT